MKIESFFRHSLIRVSLLCVLAAGVFSCSNKSDLANHIPKDANVVLAFDVKSMGYKSLNFDELLTIDNVKKALSKIGQKDTTKAPSIENAGIDFMSKAYMYVNVGEKPQGGAIVALSDAGKFETFLLDLNKDFKMTESEGIRIASEEGEKSAIGWTDKYAIVVFEVENPVTAVTTLANLKKEESLAATSAEFRALEDEAADISIWASFENLQKLMPAYSVPGAPAFDLKETFFTASCMFEDGQIAINTRYITNEENAKKFAFVRKNISNDIADAMPGKGLIGIFAMALDMTAITNYLEEQQLLSAYGATTPQFTGLEAKDLLSMLSGDVVVSLNGIQMKEVKSIDWMTGEEVTRNVPDPEYFAAIGIADKEKLAKMLKHLETSGMVTKTGSDYSFMDKVFLNEKDGSIVITGTQAMKDHAATGSGDKLSDEVRGLITSNASTFYVSLKEIPDAFYASGTPDLKANVETSELEDIIVTASSPEGKVSTGKVLVRFKNKKENSLVTLTRISKKLSEAVATPVVAANSQVDEPMNEPVAN